MDDRQRQYDRQLRLWGEEGQRALEAAHVCLVGATALGVEAVKSLALPGIGAVTIVDGEDVSEEDVGSNFFLERKSVAESRAYETLRLLLELNPAVRGFAVSESAERLLEDRPDFFRAFDVVIACGLTERALVALARSLWSADVPLIACRSVGFLCSLRVQVREHFVLDSRPDGETPDLRLREPFPALADFVASFDLPEMDPKDRAHVPWLVLVAQAAREWSRENDGRWPETRRDKDRVKEILGAICASREGEQEENLREALRAVNASLSDAPIPRDARDALYEDASVDLTSKSPPFRILCAAIRRFVDGEGRGRLPLRGAIPDMTASTERYVALQNVYRAKAAADAEAVHRIASELAAELGVEPVSETEVRRACARAAHVRVVRGSPIEEEYGAGGGRAAAAIARRLEEGDPAATRYVALRAAERFRSEQCRAPGEWDAEADVPRLKACASRLLAEWSCPPLADDDCVREMCRYGGAELHSVSAFAGGCAAQEAIKIITKQYAPLDSFLLHDAATSASATFAF